MSHLLEEANEDRGPDKVLYTLGWIGGVGEGHRVVLACASRYGNNMAAATVTNMIRSYPSVEYVLFSGIAAGIPNPAKPSDHVRLGDIVVSKNPILQYDFGKQIDGDFVSRPSPVPPSASLLQFVNSIESKMLARRIDWSGFLTEHLDTVEARRPRREPRKGFRHPPDSERMKGIPRIFLGTIGSGNVLMKSAARRDELAAATGIMALEMEGSGLADAVWNLERNYLVIRSACDYANKYKDDQWQFYSAHVAAAYLKLLLRELPAGVNRAGKVSVPVEVDPEPEIQDPSEAEKSNEPIILGSEPRILRRFENEKDHLGAMQWFVDNWQRVKSWENLIRFLTFLEAYGGSEEGLKTHMSLREKIPGEIPDSLRSRELYLLGRVRGEVGLMAMALAVHERNATTPSVDPVYPRRSRFEQGQLLFRLEEFGKSKEAMKALWEDVGDTGNDSTELKVDILKFMASFEVLHIVFDPLCAEVSLQGWSIGDIDRCTRLADRARKLAVEAKYKDGLGWSLVTRAWALEWSGDLEAARQSFDEAREIHMSGGKRTSLIHTLLYESGQLRRAGLLPEATWKLDDVRELLGDWLSPPLWAELHQQECLVARAMGNVDEARQSMRMALEQYSFDRSLQFEFEWNKARRLQAVSRSFGWEFSDFFKGE